MAENEYRIVSQPCTFYGRKYVVQIRRWWFPIWLNVDPLGVDSYNSERDAEEFAAEHAAGSREEAFLGVWEGRRDPPPPGDAP